MEDAEAEGEWRPERRQRVAKWVMLFAISAFALTAVSGAISIILTR